MSDALTHAQVRGARAMLDWSMVELAKAAHVSVSTVNRAENKRYLPVSKDAAGLIRDALETEGIRFLPRDENGPGLRLIER